MGQRLQDVRVLVTAAGDGIGREITVACAAEGASVIATNRSAEKLEGLREHDIAECLPLDVTDPVAVEKLANSVGPVNALINCAGGVRSDTAARCTPEDLQQVFDINVFGTYRVINALLPGMITNGGGSIVNIASIISSLKGAPERFSYGTSKGAMIGMTKSVAVDFASQGIRCNAICPGTIETPSLKARIAAADDPDAARATFAARHPVGRTGRPEEVAALAVHLASSESGFTTGQNFVLDGGWTA